MLSFFLVLIFFLTGKLYSFDLLLHGQIESGKEKLCFHDIASLRGEISDPETENKWQNLCNIPLPMQKTFYSKNDVEVFLWQAGLFPQKIIGAGINIKPLLVSLEQKTIANSLRRFFPSPQYTFEILNPRENYSVPALLQGNFVLDHKKKSLGKRMLYVQNSFKENILVINFILSRRQVRYTTKKNIRAGELIDENNTLPQYYYSKDNREKNSENFFGKIAAHNLRTGESITSDNTRRPPRVALGTVVLLIYKNRNIVFSIYVKTRQSGSWGDVVKAQALQGNREIKVRLTGNDSAVLWEGKTVNSQQGESL